MNYLDTPSRFQAITAVSFLQQEKLAFHTNYFYSGGAAGLGAGGRKGSDKAQLHERWCRKKGDSWKTDVSKERAALK